MWSVKDKPHHDIIDMASRLFPAFFLSLPLPCTFGKITHVALSVQYGLLVVVFMLGNCVGRVGSLTLCIHGL